MGPFGMFVIAQICILIFYFRNVCHKFIGSFISHSSVRISSLSSVATLWLFLLLLFVTIQSCDLSEFDPGIQGHIVTFMHQAINHVIIIIIVNYEFVELPIEPAVIGKWSVNSQDQGKLSNKKASLCSWRSQSIMFMGVILYSWQMGG